MPEKEIIYEIMKVIFKPAFSKRNPEIEYANISEELDTILFK